VVSPSLGGTSLSRLAVDRVVVCSRATSVPGLRTRPVDQHGAADDASQHADRGQSQPDVDELATTGILQQPAQAGDGAVSAREGDCC
jgi:hypothetical protein